MPEPTAESDPTSDLAPFSEHVAVLPRSQREVLVILKINGLTFEEIGRATASTPDARKRKAVGRKRLRSLPTRMRVNKEVTRWLRNDLQ